MTKPSFASDTSLPDAERDDKTSCRCGEDPSGYPAPYSIDCPKHGATWQRCATGPDYRVGARTPTESVALAMADFEGNEETARKNLHNAYDALGYLSLAAAAVCELERLGLFPGPAAADTPAGAAGAP